MVYYAEQNLELAIELSHAGERHLHGWDYHRIPWQATVWVGPAKKADAALRRMAVDPLVRDAIAAGARVEMSYLDGNELDARRALADEIHQRLQRVPGLADSQIDHTIYAATAAAFGIKRGGEVQAISEVTAPYAPVEEIARPPVADGSTPPKTGPASPSPAPWPPDADWHVRQNQYAYNGQQYGITGIKYQLLKVFIEAQPPLLKEDLEKRVWGNSIVDDSTLSSHLTHLRNTLREQLNLPASFDPLLRAGRGPDVTWQLNREGIAQVLQRKLSGNSASRPKHVSD